MCLIKDYAIKHYSKIKTGKEALRLYGKVDKKDKIVYKSFDEGTDYTTSVSYLVTPYTYFRWPISGHVVVPSLGIKSSYSYLEVNRGLHAYLTASRAKNEVGSIVKRMIIPAGTQYIVGENGDIVTTEMWLKKDYDKYKRSKRRNTTTSKARVSKISKKKHSSTTNRKRKRL